MAWFRRFVILSHRYLGIALSLIFVVWFASGITMMWWGGMPRLTADERLERLPALDLRAVRLTPAEAEQKVGGGRRRRCSRSWAGPPIGSAADASRYSPTPATSSRTSCRDRERDRRSSS